MSQTSVPQKATYTTLKAVRSSILRNANRLSLVRRISKSQNWVLPSLSLCIAKSTIRVINKPLLARRLVALLQNSVI